MPKYTTIDPAHTMLSSLPEDALYHILKFVDENDDARCRAFSKSWASLRRAWVVSRSMLPGGEGIQGTGHVVQAVAFSCDGKLLAIGTEGNPRAEVLTVHDAVTGDLRRTFPRPRGTLCLDFSPTDSTVLVAGGSRDLIAYNTATGNYFGNSRELWRGSQEIRCVTFSPTGSIIAFYHVRMVAVIDIGGPDPTRAPFVPARVLLTTHPGTYPGRIEGVAFSPTGSVLAVGVGTKVKCYDVASGQVRSEIAHGEYGIWNVAYSSRGIIAAGGPDGKLVLYDASNGRLIREISPAGHRSCFSPDGSMVAAHGGSASLRRVFFYDAETGDIRFVISRNYGIHPWIGAVRFSPDGKTVALGDNGGRVALYDTATGDLRRMRRAPPAA